MNYQVSYIEPIALSYLESKVEISFLPTFIKCLLLVVLTNTVEEVDTGGGKFEVLDSHVDALGNDAVSDLLVDDDSDGPGVDVKDGTGAAVVVLVGHALVNGSVDSDVNDISDLVGGEGFGDVDGSVLLETLSELVAGSTLVSVAVGHNYIKIMI